MDDLDLLGQLQVVNEAYTSAYYTKHNVYPRRSKSSDRVYKLIIKLCAREGFDLTDYVKTSVFILSRTSKYIAPRNLLDPAVITKYREFKGVNKNKDIVLLQYRSQLQELLQLLTANKDIYPDARSVLIASGTSFTAWFRVLYPDNFDEKLFDIYGELAWRELQVDAELRRSMRQLKPIQLNELEKRIAFFGNERC